MEIILQFDLPSFLRSDGGPAFTAKVSEQVVKTPGIHWKLHCTQRPQSLGQVERVNRAIKEAFLKFWAETSRQWTELLHTLCSRTKSSPYQDKMMPFEMFDLLPPLTCSYNQRSETTEMSN